MMIISTRPLLGRLAKFRHLLAGPDPIDLLANDLQHSGPDPLTFAIRSPGGTDLQQKQRSLPRGLELVRQRRYLCNVVWNCELATTEPDEDPHVAGGREIGAREPVLADL